MLRSAILSRQDHNPLGCNASVCVCFIFGNIFGIFGNIFGYVNIYFVKTKQNKKYIPVPVLI